MNVGRALPLGLALCTAVLAAWFLERGPESRATSREDGAEGTTSQPALPKASLSGGESPRRETASPESGPVDVASGTTSMRAFLADYWGERWPELEAKMAAARMDLDRPFEFVPWEAAAPSIEAKLPLNPTERTGATTGLFQWARSLDAAEFEKWIRREFSIPRTRELDDLTLLEIQDVARPFNDEIAVLAEDWADRIDLYTLQRFHSGNFVKAPISTIGVSSETGFSCKSIADSGWSIVITLKREDYPDMVWIEHRAAELREERDMAITTYLRRSSGR